MDNKQVSFAKHSIFYKKFFERQGTTLSSIMGLTFQTLEDGYLTLYTFWSGYSHYLNDGSQIDKVILKERELLFGDSIHVKLSNKLNKGVDLKPEELVSRNNIYYKHLVNIFEKFEDFCDKLAPDDLMPNLTSSYSDYEKNVMFASYEVFYEYFFNFHERITTNLSEHNIVKFFDIFRELMAFYYGYSYYISKHTQSIIKIEFNRVWNDYNNTHTMKLVYGYLVNGLNSSGMNELKTVQDRLFIDCVNIFGIINNDFPKKNIMPKKKEKISYDATGI